MCLESFHCKSFTLDGSTGSALDQIWDQAGIDHERTVPDQPLAAGWVAHLWDGGLRHRDVAPVLHLADGLPWDTGTQFSLVCAHCDIDIVTLTFYPVGHLSGFHVNISLFMFQLLCGHKLLYFDIRALQVWRTRQVWQAQTVPPLNVSRSRQEKKTR